MHFCDLTLPSAAENLACDEALLEAAEAGEMGEVLRFWEPQRYFVVLGYGNKAETEINLTFCRNQGIPIHRRCSGGGAVLQGPGVLNYSLILQVDNSGPCHSISAANQFIMERHRKACSDLLGQPVEISGCTDLSKGGLKFSGNAQRRKQSYLLFHGSFLLNLDFTIVERALSLPSRQPEYRGGRSHTDFLTNLKLAADEIKIRLQETWRALAPLPSVPSIEIRRLLELKYGREEWNLKS